MATDEGHLEHLHALAAIGSNCDCTLMAALTAM